LRPVWSTERVQDSQGYIGKPCLEKQREREREREREKERESKLIYLGGKKYSKLKRFCF
jgi:hypothetical protein